MKEGRRGKKEREGGREGRRQEEPGEGREEGKNRKLCLMTSSHIILEIVIHIVIVLERPYLLPNLFFYTDSSLYMKYHH